MKNYDRWMTVLEVADYLQISRAKIYSMAQLNEIPCTKVAGHWRFKRDEIDRWMQAQAAPGPRVTASTSEKPGKVRGEKR